MDLSSKRKGKRKKMSKRFLPGNDGHGGGRPIGSRNKLQGDFLKALAADFAEHGAGVIRIVRIEKPVEWLKCIVAVLPKEMIIEQGVLADLSDEDLAAHISLLQRMQVGKKEQQETTPDGDGTKH
jgi:hypothetical protein